MTWNRRKFLKTALFGAGGAILADSLWLEKFYIETNEFFLGNANETNKGIRLVQISDLHLREITNSLNRLAQRVNRIKPDLILITGDAIDDKNNLDLLNNFLGLISHDTKKAAILGNWEYWGEVNIKKLKEIYSAHNCHLLVNQTRQYTFGDKTISITGVDDFVAGTSDVELAVEHYKKSDFHIVLNHCPAYSDSIAIKTPKEIKIDLILSGHTHGGQINIFGIVPFLPQGSGKYVKGWYEDELKKLYVSKGIGTSILPARFGARAEIAIFNLV
jgi:predicted MPP superfamily phosphohydrolase